MNLKTGQFFPIVAYRAAVNPESPRAMCRKSRLRARVPPKALL